METSATKPASASPAREVSGTGIQMRFAGVLADYYESKRIAEGHGGRLPTLAEFLAELKNPHLRDTSKGHWYWLGDKPGLTVSGWCRLDQNGTVVRVESYSEWKKLFPSERILVNPGSGPAWIFVRPENVIVSADTPPAPSTEVAFVLEGHAQQPSTAELRKGE